MKHPIDFNLFARLNQTVSREKLANGELFQLENAVLNNPKGVITSRGGFPRKNSNLTTSPITKLVDSVDPSGQSYFLAGMSAKIQKSSGGAWSDVVTGLSTDYFYHTQVKDGIVFTNGEDTPQFITGTGWGTIENVEIERPDVTDTKLLLTTTVGGSMNDGMQMYCVVYKTEDGNLSPPSDAIFAQTPAGVIIETGSSFSARLLYNLPVSSDSRVTKKIIFRTESSDPTTVTGRGRVFYKLEEIDNAETQFEDELPDSYLDFGTTLTFLRAPKKAGYVITHGDRLFFGDVTVENKFFLPIMMASKIESTSRTGNGSGRSYTNTGDKLNPITSSYTHGNGTGLIPNYYYQYLQVFVDKDGRETDPIYSDVFQVPAGANFANVTIGSLTKDGFFADYERAHPLIAKRRVYRTEGQVSTFTTKTGTYKLLVEEDTNPASEYRLSPVYIDTTSDGSLGATYDPDQTERYPSAISFSKPNRVFTFYLEDIRNIEENDQDVITGIAEETDGIVVFKRDNIYKVYTSGASASWFLRLHYAGIGCNDSKSVFSKSNVIFFRHNYRMYMMPQASVPQEIGEPALISLEKYKTTLQVDATNEWLILTAQDSASSQGILIYDFIVGSWYVFPFSGKTLQGVVVKKYTLTSYVVSEPYFAFDEIIYNYTPDDSRDYFTGSAVYPTVTVGFPYLKLDETTPMKLRHLVTSCLRLNQEDIFFTYTDIDTPTPATSVTDSYDASETRLRKFNLNYNGIASRYQLIATGGINQLNALRTYVRPVKRGYVKQ